MGDEERDQQQDDTEGQRRTIKPDEADQPDDTQGHPFRWGLEDGDAEGKSDEDDAEGHRLS
jgi:hypothetical protein